MVLRLAIIHAPQVIAIKEGSKRRFVFKKFEKA